MTTTTIKIDKISWADLDRFAHNSETPAGVSLWAHQVVDVMDLDRATVLDAITTSAPLAEEDADYLGSLYDAMQASEKLPNHAYVDWAYTDDGDEFVDAIQQILRTRSAQLLGSTFIRFVR